jgi:hypothetical protein
MHRYCKSSKKMILYNDWDIQTVDYSDQELILFIFLTSFF